MMQDKYSRKRIPMKIKLCTLENRFLKASFMPEYGGRLYSLFDKMNGRELLMKNPVFQPANLAIRNAWFSGGIEWNIGSLGHTFTTCDNVFSAILQDNDGNDFLRIYEFERCTGVFWQIDFHLPEDSRVLISHVRIVNPFNEDTTTYWWSNIAVPDDGGTRVLASSERAVLFLQGKLGYSTLPFIDEMPGADVSYPSQATRGFDYFIQPDEDEDGAWEAAAYKDGLVFFERSNSPLLYRKMFCWGNHHAGKHWQEFLAEEGEGYYAEIQAGIAPSQMHDRVLKANGTLEWTQCFGGVMLERDKLHDTPLTNANKYFGEKLDSIISDGKINEYEEKYRLLADLPVKASNIIHNGSGFGALETIRMEKDGDAKPPISMCFPVSTLSKEQYQWVYLLENGIMPEESPDELPVSWMTSKKWLALMEKSLERPGGRTWFSLLHYGVALYEQTDTTKVASEAETWEGLKESEEKAVQAWHCSVNLCPSVWAYRNLAVAAQNAGNNEAAEKYYDTLFSLNVNHYSLASEYLKLLNTLKKYDTAWALYERLPNDIKKVDRIMIFAAIAAVKLRNTEFLKEFFKRTHHDIREGECSLTDLWFEYNAILMAKNQNIENPTNAELAALVDRAWDECPPPKEIDFRMSFDNKNKYRIDG